MDGTLVNSTALVESTWSSFSHLHGLDLSEVLDFAHGRPTRETVSHFVSSTDLAASETKRLVDHEESETTGITEVPGSAELLAGLTPGAWAIVTSASRKLAEVRLTAAGLPIQDVLVSADDVVRGKPSPEGYAHAAAILGVALSETIVFEDSAAGVQAGIASGARTVVIGNLTSHDGTLERYVDFRGLRATGSPDGVDLTLPEPVALGAVQR